MIELHDAVNGHSQNFAWALIESKLQTPFKLLVIIVSTEAALGWQEWTPSLHSSMAELSMAV